MDELSRLVADAWKLELPFAERVVRLYRMAMAQGLTRWRVIDAWRDPARQERLYAQGRTAPGPIVTNAKAWESAHQWGLAIDIEAEPGVLRQLGALAPLVGLEWGGNWTGKLVDAPHFQMADWRKHRNQARRT